MNYNFNTNTSPCSPNAFDELCTHGMAYIKNIKWCQLMYSKYINEKQVVGGLTEFKEKIKLTHWNIYKGNIHKVPIKYTEIPYFKSISHLDKTQNTKSIVNEVLSWFFEVLSWFFDEVCDSEDCLYYPIIIETLYTALYYEDLSYLISLSDDEISILDEIITYFNDEDELSAYTNTLSKESIDIIAKSSTFQSLLKQLKLYNKYTEL